MAYFRTAPATGKPETGPKNRVWIFPVISVRLHPVLGSRPLQPRRKNRPTATKTVSGIPRWPSREPLGEQASVNLVAYIWNDPVIGWDVLGLFGAGNPRGFKGHGQFTTPDGSKQGGDPAFDYNREDTGDTGPFNDPERHFRPRTQSDKDVEEAVKECDSDKYSRAAHRGQDSFSHYDKGYRWAPFQAKSFGYGHFFDGDTPDNDNDAWAKAEDWTKKQKAVVLF